MRQYTIKKVTGQIDWAEIPALDVDNYLWCEKLDIRMKSQICYDEQGLYRNETVYDDFDLILRLRKAGNRIAIRNVVLANFRTGGASNEKSLKKCVNRLKARYGYYRRNGYSRLYIFECVAMEIAKFILA